MTVSEYYCKKLNTLRHLKFSDDGEIQDQSRSSILVPFDRTHATLQLHNFDFFRTCTLKVIRLMQIDEEFVRF